MKAVIMAAGKGTRMLPLTENTHKVLIPISGTPFLGHLLRNLVTAGISEFCFIVGHMQHQIREYVTSFGIIAVFIEQAAPLGTGQAVGLARSFTAGDDFIVCGGDNLWSARDIKEVMNQKACCVTGYTVAHPSMYGVLVEKNGLLKTIVEKPEKFMSSIANTGLYKFTPEIYSFIDTLTPSLRGELELTDAIQKLANLNKITVLTIQDYWIDLGKVTDVPIVEELVKGLT